MNILNKLIKYFLGQERNVDWRIVALDLNRKLIETEEKLQQANQRIADLEKIVAIYKEKEQMGEQYA
ncbi:hypothetical protein OLD38_02850 [Streptococcus pneumoniae]|nr:hypothetical protein [Streptococcus pneumoniae]MDG8893091.1 hypothetical protein [Streptococcus pneumoniae]MDG9649100.1 hypothetical protein [Streptococcus pneumoniae]VQD69538.1 Uncharacterised protein [Streptococcus pneumoniae]VQD93423.1 Uncharacterised protein [Streptococcus pneumoniae]